MSEGIRLIVGLGNPGPQYRDTRHNAGAWFLDALCARHRAELRADAKFFGEAGRVDIQGHDLRLLFPTTFMNRSGQAVAAMAQYFKIPPESILVVYDELDLPAGTPRLKQGGGPGGHNGVRDIIKALGSREFWRLRLGIGHPGDSSKVLNFVLSAPSRQEAELVEQAIERSLDILPLVLKGQSQQAMTQLHTRPDNGKAPAQGAASGDNKARDAKGAKGH